ncbi:hypothetical protein TWF788_002992 [Orbilia oligospora]|uniref:CBM1 domain-containing protein n=2 Tax=Orbilia oligospora TaxID=2813651 RepID=A0A6G1MH41_ORBOL|nr:hypothetical protein TWF788_002992 [Orbilia oligospora]KAF3212559.1 hypothetical protein TWF679_005749 [Orbilia oligospora]KAF3258234.1 hypothetical protein TWF192_000369 [Orbilia oligospora]
MYTKGFISGAVIIGAAAAQQTAWGQCGGSGWTGPTTCVSGYTCTYSNDWYSQCLPGAAGTTAKTTTTTARAATTTAAASNPTPTLYLCGDSTMAKSGANDGSTDGWGNQVAKYFTGITVNNQAIGGRSARSYTREGRFNTVIGLVKAGDFVVIEFGHNDGGSLTSTDNGRTDCPGTGSETCPVTYNGVAETVLTFSAYLEKAANALKAKGAIVILSSQTPNNPWEGVTTFPSTSNPVRFVPYTETSASRTGTTYVNHWLYSMDLYKRLGASATNAVYPKDHTHTSPTGADHMARSFIKGLQCSSNALKNKINASAASVVSGSCL